MQATVTSVSDYLTGLPSDRKSVIEALRQVILKNLDSTYEERIEYGILGYAVPNKMYPAGYMHNPDQPLMITGIASRKGYISFYLGGPYCGCGQHLDTDTPDMTWFKQAWAKTGKKLSIGKACIKFKKIDDLALDVIAEAMRRISVKQCIDSHEAVMQEKMEKKNDSKKLVQSR